MLQACACSLPPPCLVSSPRAPLAAPPAGFAQRVERTAQGISACPAWRSRSSRTAGSPSRRATAYASSARPHPVDADTIFPTGSTGKAFTVAALAILVDQGKIGWDDKVIDHMPWFQMYDPWVTREMTIRDLLVHRSGLGLGAGDLLFVPRTNLSRARIGAAAALHQPGDQLPQRLCL